MSDPQEVAQFNEAPIEKILEGLEISISVNCNLEPRLKGLAELLNDSGNGKVIQIPGQKPFRVDSPNERKVMLCVVEGIRLLLQGSRLTMYAVRSLVKESTRQAEARSGKVGDERGSQSPDVDFRRWAHPGCTIQHTTEAESNACMKRLEASPQGSQPPRTAS